MNILYMGYFCNDNLFNELVNHGSKSSHARQQFEKKMLLGLMENCKEHNLQIVSYLPRVDSGLCEKSGEDYNGIPIKYVWSKKTLTSVLNAIICNIKNIKQWATHTDGSKVILTYSANPINCIPAMLLRRKYDYKVVTVCSEISIYRRGGKHNIVSWIHKKISYWLENNFDAYVMLSKYMEEVINFKKRPCAIVEGFAEPEFREPEVGKRENILLYAGGISEDNGIKILVEGFKKHNKGNLELWLCGDGKLVDYVKEQSQLDERIKYKGILKNVEVQRLERKAKFLINPRFSEEDYTKYSFPSKTLEYMSSGTPTILTRLKGIPQEYFEHVIVLDEENIEGVQKLLESIEKESYEKHLLMAKKALIFVKENKTPQKQGKKILDFLCNL